jgi:hypothetical protein
MTMDATATVNSGGGGGVSLPSSSSSSPSSSSSSCANNNGEDIVQQLHSQPPQSQQQQQQQPNYNNNDDEDDLSFCLLWSPLHPITALLPFIGHMGISDSRGQAHDFQGPYYIGTDNSKPTPKMAFGYPTRYIKIKNISQFVPGGSQQWDESIIEADNIYRQRMHNICCDNCHSHVARALNIMEYQGRHDWDMVKLCFWVFFKGSFVGACNNNGGNLWSSILLQFGPFLIILLIILHSTGVLFKK